MAVTLTKPGKKVVADRDSPPERFTFSATDNLSRPAARVGVTEGQLLLDIRALEAGAASVVAGTTPLPPVVSPDPPPPFTVRVRRIDGPADSGREFTEGPVGAFRAAAESGAGTLIEWPGKDRLCVLDVDYHGGRSPGEYLLATMAARLMPAPAAWWE